MQRALLSKAVQKKKKKNKKERKKLSLWCVRKWKGQIYLLMSEISTGRTVKLLTYARPNSTKRIEPFRRKEKKKKKKSARSGVKLLTSCLGDQSDNERNTPET